MRIITENQQILTKTATAYGQSKEIGVYALASALNALTAEGAEHFHAEVRIMIPAYAFKSRIHTMEKIMKNICKEKNIELAEIKSERNSVIAQTMVIVTVTGYAPLEEKKEAVHVGQDVVLTKWIGMEGMLRITTEKESELRERFSPGFLKQILSYKEEIFAEKEIHFAKDMGVSFICQVSEGGILAALWNLAKETETGLEADLRHLPVRQETIEVCEFFRLNPYQLTSTGCMLMVTADGEKLVEAMHEQGMAAEVIGRLTDNNDKILHNGEEIRYIDRPAPDELMKIFEQSENKIE